MVSRYQKRISGPLLDRIDIHIEVPRVEYEKLSDERLGEPLGISAAQLFLLRSGLGGIILASINGAASDITMSGLAMRP